MSTGIRISDKDTLAGADFVFALHNGTSGPLATTALGTILAASGAIADAIASVSADVEALQAIGAAGAQFTSGGPVACATTADITLSGEQTIDGVATSTSRVLVKDQAAPEENGIYVSAAGAWARAGDLDVAGEVAGTLVQVEAGTAHGLTVWACYSEVTTLDTDAITWVAATDLSGVGAALAAKAPLASPTFTGVPAAPTATTGTNTTQLATTAFVQQEIAPLAPAADPTFTGTVTVPTPAEASDTTVAASTAWVRGFAGEAVQAVEVIDGNFTSVSYAVVDEEDRVLLAFDKDGVQLTPELGGANFETWGNDFSPILAALVTGAGDAAQVWMALQRSGETEVPGGIGTREYMIEAPVADDFSDHLHAVTTATGQVLLRIGRDGRVHFPGGYAGEDRTLKRMTVDRAPDLEAFIADIMHIIGLGQSNMVRGAQFVLPVSAKDHALSAGIQVAEEDTGNTLARLDAQVGGSTVDSGVAWNAIQQMRWMQSGGLGYDADETDDASARYLLTTHGVNGAALDELDKGGLKGAFEDSMFAVQEAQRLALASGRSSHVAGAIWLQGEADSDDGTDPVTYLATFRQMVADYRADIPAETGQAAPVVFFTYQLSSECYYGAGGDPVPAVIADALFQAAETDPDIVIAGPTYPVPHADAVHLDGAGGRDFGLQFGKVMFKRLWRGEDWHPVEPRRITQHSVRVVSCRFHVPEPPLVFDTATVTDPGDYGFVIEDDSGTVAISELRILRDTVVITTSADIGANPRLSYAYYGTAGNGGGPATGCRGNLRDSDPTTGPNGARLWNWGVIFNKPIPYEKGA